MTMRSFCMYDMFERNAALTGRQTALVCSDTRISFEELLTKTRCLASALLQRGIAKGDRIAILAHNCHDFFYLFGAAAALGAVVVAINWRLSDDEIRYILSDSSPKLLAADGNHAHRVKELAMPFVAGIGNCKEYPSLESLMASADAAFSKSDVGADDPFCIIYTAAVAGKPRGAVLTHGNMIAANIQTAATMGLSDKDVCLNNLPLFHITGLNLAFAVMHVGGKNVVIEKFDEKQCLELTQSEKVSVMGSFPPILSRLTAEANTKSYDLSSLRIILGIDGPDNIIPFEEKTKAEFWILYGQSETSGLVTFSPASEKPGSAGKIGLLSKVKIVNDKDIEMPIGESGEIVVQGPLVFQGYLNQDEANAYTFRNGWHHTGDWGVLDKDGYLWFKGRKPEKELIKPGGENVYPAEVEEVILQHSDIADVSVIGVPDVQFGEGIKAVCVLKPGRTLSEKALIEFVADRIARYKKPRYVAFADSLPKTSGGSTDREKVKQLYGK